LSTSRFTPEALNDIGKLPRNIKNALKKEFKKRIQPDPIGCSVELSEPLRGFRSFHLGKVRVIFRVYEDRKTIAVVGGGERTPTSESDIYKKLEKLASQGKLADKVLAALRMFSNP
jgi:mRNA-degrading endonuclease RelE of RelBE toxin-antitoxin system